METTEQNSLVNNNFDLKLFLNEILRRKVLIIALVVAGLVVSFFYTKLFCKPKYTSCAKLLITNTNINPNDLNTSDFYVSSYLINDYSEIIVDKVVLSRVVQELGLDVSVQALRSRITIANPNNSRILEVYVTSGNAAESERTANKICAVAKDEIKNIIGADSVNIMSNATLPSSPSSPNLKKNLGFGLIAGCGLSLLAIILLYYTDDKIKGNEDVKKYLGLAVLGNIPYSSSKKKKDIKGRARV